MSGNSAREVGQSMLETVATQTARALRGIGGSGTTPTNLAQGIEACSGARRSRWCLGVLGAGCRGHRSQVAAKKFTDNTVPQGIVAATYQIKAHRGTQSSAGSEPVAVLFGSQLQLAA